LNTRYDSPPWSGIVLPSTRQSASDRLAVYQHAYFARLIDCLRELFPVLVATLGRDDFDRFAAEYLVHYPPPSYTLNHLADRFIDYLMETRPDVSSPGWPDFLIDLARVEHTIDQVFDGPGIEESPPLDVNQLSALSPDELLALRFVPAPCLRLLDLRFPVNDYYTSIRRGESPPWPPPARSCLAITRREYVVRRVPLEQPEYQVLAALVGGRTLGEALAAAEPLSPLQVKTWFTDWGRLGLLAGYR